MRPGGSENWARLDVWALGKVDCPTAKKNAAKASNDLLLVNRACPMHRRKHRRETDEFAPPGMLVPRHKGGKPLAELVSEGRGEPFEHPGHVLLGNREFNQVWVEVIRGEDDQIIGVQGASPEDLETLALHRSFQQAREGKTKTSAAVRKRLGLDPK